LAAITFDALLERARPVLGLSRVQKLAYLGLAVLLGVVVGLVPSTPLSVWLSAWVWLPVVFAISAGWIVLRARRGLFARSTLIVLASAVSMIDLGCFAAVYAKTYDMMLPIADLDARPRVLDVLQGLSPQDGRVMTSLWIYPVQDTMRASLYPNVSMIYGVANAVGYTPLIMQRVSEYLDEMNAPMLNLSNARYYLRPQLLPVDAATEGSDLQNEFEPDFLGGRITFAPTAASQVTIVSSLAQSVDWPDGKPVATVTLYTENGDEYQFSLRAGLDTAEWAYERSDVRAIVKHSMPQVATTFPAYSAFPVEQHPGHNYLARFDVTQNGQPRRVTGVSVTPLVDPGLIHVEKLSFVSPDGIETSLASLIGRDDQTLIYRDAQHVAVFENPDALPRAFLVHDAIVADDETALGAMTRDDFKPQQELILSEGKALQAGGAQSPDEQVRIVDYADERVLVSVHASRPGYLLLADTWYPGWSASVDGAPTPITRADLIFRALPVTPGTHQVEFVFRPTSVYVGAAISGVGVLILLGIAIASRRRNA
ncbi:MAG: YfhO family protein, partial [Chloroflexi bacterium]|nr:YfhO family protein [Chloroflexota bacterium]